MENKITVETVVTVNGVTKTYSAVAETNGDPRCVTYSVINGVAAQATREVSDYWWRNAADGPR